MSDIRMTYATAAVLQALEHGCRYGFDIAEAARLRGGTVYPILRRLEDAGYLSGHWEAARISRVEGRPARRYYRLNAAARPLLDMARERYPIAWLGATPQPAKGSA